jgi:hypothetical protein
MNPAAATIALIAAITSCAMAQPPELPPLPPEVMRMMEEFNNRKKYAEFDLATLQAIKDEHLEQAILDYIFAKLDARPGQRVQVISNLPPAFQAFYMSWLVEAEVMNGGFNQYFWNSSSEFAEQTPAALAVIGDEVAAEMMQRAIAVAIAEIPSMKKYKSAATLEAFSDSYKHTKLIDLDKPFCKRAEGFPALRLHYVRDHQQSFVTQ